jgi:hypothetical protein
MTMTPADLISECGRAGVVLAVEPSGKLSYRGNREAINRLLPAIRENKTGLLALLAVPPIGIDSKHKSTRESYAADLETIARAFAGQLRTTAEYFLSLLDDTDKAAIQANQPGYLEAWRCAVRLNVQMGLAPRPAPTTNKPAKSVQCQECQHAKPTESPVITECGAGVRSYSYLGEYRRSTQETCFCAKFEPLE